jgi:BASS family bile acid:Na+ symporter
MELGVHNAALAIAVGTSIEEVLGIPAAVYSVFQLVTAGAFARLMHRRNGAGLPEALPAGANAPMG